MRNILRITLLAALMALAGSLWAGGFDPTLGNPKASPEARCRAPRWPRISALSIRWRPAGLRIIYNGVDTVAVFAPQQCSIAVRGDAPPPGRGPAHARLCSSWPTTSSSRAWPRRCACWPGCAGATGAGATGGRAGNACGPGGGWLPSWASAPLVWFVGPVENPLADYAAADVYVHPTIYDTCSLVVLEAAACGLPVITTRCNGAAELFHEDRDVLLVSDPADDVAFAAKAHYRSAPAARRCWATPPGRPP